MKGIFLKGLELPDRGILIIEIHRDGDVWTDDGNEFCHYGKVATEIEIKENTNEEHK